MGGVVPTAAGAASYVMGHGLRLRGLPTPRPLAVWHRTRLGLPCAGHLLAEMVPGALELPDHVAGLSRPPPRNAGRP